MPAFGTRNTLKMPSEIRTSGVFLNISVRLRIPNGLSLFTKIPMNVIYEDEATSLNDIFSNQEINNLVDLLIETTTDNEKCRLLEIFLVSKLINCQPQLFLELITKIHDSKGECRVSQLATFFSVSERTIHRLSNKLVGVNPINYINLIRFRNVMQLSSRTKADLLSNTLDAGYYDQSHFIKQFKTFSTFTPLQFLEINSFEKVSNFYNI
ncbi:AraC family transcriptional regulator [Flavobacterium sp.]|uniref:helix-turn-helix domain-containing protein n=1 Tax=Flavobacterium sp. TaxID=239 RepID=UPI0025B86071|nr:helix-turn-helix domain-containing protein [Flavobacterium sp.]